jgi:hypothetical protein
MKKFLGSLLPNLKKLVERGLSIAAFIFPLVEITSYFGPKVFLSSGSVSLRGFYLSHLMKVANFYANNNILFFVFMVWIFIVCSRGSLPLTRFLRFNVVQAILLSVICSCFGIIFTFFPIVLRESMIGLIIANFLFLGIMLLVTYSSLLITYGRYPTIPILSDAAKMQVQQNL